MPPRHWKVGELAKATGVSVRALHYYEEIGLLIPSHRTEAGYRLYAEADIARLQQIRSLRQLGLSLEAVGECLRQPDFSPLRLIEEQLLRVRGQLALQQALCTRLERIAALLRAAESVSVEEFLATIEAMTMLNKYWSAEQLAEIDERRRQLGVRDEDIRQVETDWQDVIQELRAHKQQGTDPASEPVRQLAQRYADVMGRIQAFWSGVSGSQQAVGAMWSQEPQIAGHDTGEVRSLLQYMASGAPKAP